MKSAGATLSFVVSLFFALSLLYGCKTNPYAKTNKIYSQRVKNVTDIIRQPLPPPHKPAPADEFMDRTFAAGAGETIPEGSNSGMRKGEHAVGAVHFGLRKPNYVVIHHTAQDSLQQTLQTFTLPHTQVSAHYVIGRDGEIYQMLNDYLRGWHAGVGKWGSITDLNSVSLGIELDNNGKEPFPDIQINSLMILLDTLKTAYSIPTANFLAHSDIAPGRKVDPSALFPWKELAERGFGLWPDEVLVTPPDNFNAEDALRIIGYDTSNLRAAIMAFKLRYIQNDLSPELTLYNQSVLYNLYLKY